MKYGDTLTAEQKLHYDAFMEATEGHRSHLVVRCVNEQTPGISWGKCAKGNIAEVYARAKAPGDYVGVFTVAAKINLETLKTHLLQIKPRY